MILSLERNTYYFFLIHNFFGIVSFPTDFLAYNKSLIEFC